MFENETKTLNIVGKDGDEPLRAVAESSIIFRTVAGSLLLDIDPCPLSV